MSAQFKIIQILESYTPLQFADFVSKNGFPECCDYIVQNKIRYTDFKGIYKYHLKSFWETAIDFKDFNDFCDFQKKLQTSPEAFFDDINTVIKNNVESRPKPSVLNKPSIATKPIGIIKPGLPQKPVVSPKFSSTSKLTDNFRSASLDAVDISCTSASKSHIHRVQSQISEEIKAKISGRKIPRPPKSVNLESVPNLPDYYEYKSHPSSQKGSLGDICDFDADDEDEEVEYEQQPMYSEPPEEGSNDDGSTEDEENSYCEAKDVQEHVEPNQGIPPKIDRQMKPKPIRHIPQQNNIPNRIISQNSVGDEDDEDDVHFYVELPPCPSQQSGHQTKENAYTMEPTNHNKHGAGRVDDENDYLAPTPRLTLLPAPSTEQKRPLPPIPGQIYTLDDLTRETYFREVDRQQAAKILQTEPIGAFLVRPSKGPKFFCSFSIKSASRIIHIGIVKTEENKFYLDGKDEGLILFHSITDMTNCYIGNGVDVQEGNRVTHVNLLNIMKPLK